MKAAMILVLGLMFGASGAWAAEAHDHDHGAKAGKVQSLGGGKSCDKCNKDKVAAKSGTADSLGGGRACKDGKCGKGKEGCCCAGKMSMMHDMDGMNHDAMTERMQKMEERMEKMEKMMANPPAKS